MISREELVRILVRLALPAAVGLSTACGEGLLLKDPLPSPLSDSGAGDTSDASQDGGGEPDRSSPSPDSSPDRDTVDASDDHDEGSDVADAAEACAPAECGGSYDYFVDAMAESPLRCELGMDLWNSGHDPRGFAFAV
jgi:hypothetical protein